MQKYKVELTPTAQKAYEEIHADAQACITAGDTTNAKVIKLRMVDDAIDNIIPHKPFAVQKALSEPLSNIFRVKKVLGVIDGSSPKGVEGQSDIAWRHDLLRKIGYKR